VLPDLFEFRNVELQDVPTSQALADDANALRAGGFATASLYDTITILNIPTNQYGAVIPKFRANRPPMSVPMTRPPTFATR
jgi:hypothetical protein